MVGFLKSFLYIASSYVAFFILKEKEFQKMLILAVLAIEANIAIITNIRSFLLKSIHKWNFFSDSCPLWNIYLKLFLEVITILPIYYLKVLQSCISLILHQSFHCVCGWNLSMT